MSQYTNLMQGIGLLCLLTNETEKGRSNQKLSAVFPDNHLICHLNDQFQIYLSNQGSCMQEQGLSFLKLGRVGMHETT